MATALNSCNYDPLAANPHYPSWTPQIQSQSPELIETNVWQFGNTDAQNYFSSLQKSSSSPLVPISTSSVSNSSWIVNTTEANTTPHFTYLSDGIHPSNHSSNNNNDNQTND